MASEFVAMLEDIIRRYGNLPVKINGKKPCVIGDPENPFIRIINEEE